MYSRRASRIREERLTRARLAAPFVARSNSESNTTWMVSILWKILHSLVNSQTTPHQGATAPGRQTEAENEVETSCTQLLSTSKHEKAQKNRAPVLKICHFSAYLITK
jgi:hypothetical protein